MPDRIELQLRIWRHSSGTKPSQLEAFSSIESFVEWWNANPDTHGVQLSLELEELDRMIK
jgi:hypothetical protein